MNDTYFEIKPSTFILNATYTGLGDEYGTMCPIGIIPNSANFIILGVPFMKNFYVIFDLDSDRVGISNLYSTST